MGILQSDTQPEPYRRRCTREGLCVAMQVEFKRHILKPFYHLICARVETRRLSAMGSYGSGGVNVHRPTLARGALHGELASGPPLVVGEGLTPCSRVFRST
jgi:hypothetical protein